MNSYADLMDVNNKCYQKNTSGEFTVKKNNIKSFLVIKTSECNQK